MNITDGPQASGPKKEGVQRPGSNLIDLVFPGSTLQSHWDSPHICHFPSRVLGNSQRLSFMAVHGSLSGQTHDTLYFMTSFNTHLYAKTCSKPISLFNEGILCHQCWHLKFVRYMHAGSLEGTVALSIVIALLWNKLWQILSRTARGHSNETNSSLSFTLTFNGSLSSGPQVRTSNGIQR